MVLQSPRRALRALLAALTRPRRPRRALVRGRRAHRFPLRRGALDARTHARCPSPSMYALFLDVRAPLADLADSLCVLILTS